MLKRNSQGGMTLLGWVVVLALIIFFMMLGFRLFPIYYKSYAVDRALTEVAEDSSISLRDASEMRDSLRKRLNVNNISVVEASDLEIEDIDDGVRLILAYEERTAFIGNLYLVADFRKTAVVRD